MPILEKRVPKTRGIYELEREKMPFSPPLPPRRPEFAIAVTCHWSVPNLSSLDFDWTYNNFLSVVFIGN